MPNGAGEQDGATVEPVTEVTIDVQDDEPAEVTPGAIRLRERVLAPRERKRRARAAG